MKDSKHLPMFGVGPIYGAVIIAVTVTAVFLGQTEPFKFGIFPELKIPSATVGISRLAERDGVW